MAPSKKLSESSFFQQGADPYKWLASIFGKTDRAIRSWTYDWSGPSGAKPTIFDFFYLVSIAGSDRAVALLKKNGRGITPEDQLRQYGNLIKTVADRIRKLADNLDTLSEKYENADYKNNDI